MSPAKRLFGSRKFWVSFGSGIIAVGGQVAPFLALLCGWDGVKLTAFKSACDGISAAVTGLGGVLVIMIGAEDAAEKVALPPPAVERT